MVAVASNYASAAPGDMRSVRFRVSSNTEISATDIDYLKTMIHKLFSDPVTGVEILTLHEENATLRAELEKLRAK